MENNKETPEEELYEKCFQEVLNRKSGAVWFRRDHIAVAELYHKTLLSQSIPSEEGLRKIFDTMNQDGMLFSEFKAAIELLTKGEK